MLHTQAVNPSLLALLKAIMLKSEFEKFRLVGGTSLALQEGHRISIDIDLFGNCTLNEVEINQALRKAGPIQQISKSPNILIYVVNGVKVDFVNYQYKWLEDPVIEEGIVMASKADIAAMKLNAIAGRGSKKDFIDLSFLLKFYTLDSMIDFYRTKYPDGSEFMVLKSLFYFEDADKENDPKMLIEYNWKDIKRQILSETKKLL